MNHTEILVNNYPLPCPWSKVMAFRRRNMTFCGHFGGIAIGNSPYFVPTIPSRGWGGWVGVGGGGSVPAVFVLLGPGLIWWLHRAN